MALVNNGLIKNYYIYNRLCLYVPQNEYDTIKAMMVICVQ
ncbi:hypothetical protein IMSAG192_00630 [Muribaculaceae bacterium]|nr:hypothetical protein IMSAG192_00630 [Muribaculaceae bacterium]